MLTIRRASIGDEELLAVLNRFVHDLHVQHRPDQFKQPQRADVVDWYKSILAKPHACALIAETNNTPVGYVLTIVHHSSGNAFASGRSVLEIDQLAVDPQYRRRGIGRALVLEAIAQANAEGVEQVEASSWSFNEETHAFFRRLGFTPKSVRFELAVPARSSTMIRLRP